MPSVSRSSFDFDVTVGGSCLVSPNRMTCSALAAARAHNNAGSVVCAASSKTTISNSDPFRPVCSVNNCWAATQLVTTTGADRVIISCTSLVRCLRSKIAEERTCFSTKASPARRRSSTISGTFSAMATTVRCWMLGAIDAGRPCRMAGTPICNSASNSTSAAPLLWVTASTRGLVWFSIFICNAADTINAAALVFPVPGGPLTSPIVRCIAQDTASFWDWLGENSVLFKACSKAYLVKCCISQSGPNRVGILLARLFACVEFWNNSAKRDAAAPASPFRSRSKAIRCARRGACAAARSRRIWKSPGCLRVSHRPCGQLLPTPTVIQSLPTSTTIHSRGSRSTFRFRSLLSGVMTKTSPRENKSRKRWFPGLCTRTIFSPRISLSGSAVASNTANPFSSSLRSDHIFRRSLRSITFSWYSFKSKSSQWMA